LMRTPDVYAYTTHRLVQLCAAMRSVSGAERQGCLCGGELEGVARAELGMDGCCGCVVALSG